MSKLARWDLVKRFREIVELPERPKFGTIPPSSSGYDPEVVPELRRTFSLNVFILKVNIVVLFVAALTLVVAGVTLIATLLTR